VAGAQLALTVTRMDRYGNRVPRREGLAPLHGRASQMLLKTSYDTFVNPRFLS